MQFTRVLEEDLHFSCLGKGVGKGSHSKEHLSWQRTHELGEECPGTEAVTGGGGRTLLSACLGGLRDVFPLQHHDANTCFLQNRLPKCTAGPWQPICKGCSPWFGESKAWPGPWPDPTGQWVLKLMMIKTL